MGSSFNKVLISFIITTLFYLSSSVIFTFRFGTNDDVFMLLYSSGALINEPSQFLIFIHYFLGLFLKYLYTASDVISWYTLLLYLAHFAGTWVVIYFIYKHSASFLFATVISLLFFFGIDLLLLLKIQFTSTAIKSACVGLFLFFQSIYTKESKIRIKEILLIAGFLLVSLLVRKDGLYSVLLLSLPILGLHFFLHRRVEIIFFYAIIGLSLVAANQLHTRHYYLNNGQDRLFELVEGQGVLMNDPLHVTDETLATVNWTQNDFKLMHEEWFFVDPNKYNAESFATLSQLVYAPHNLGDAIKSFIHGLYIFKRSMVFGCFILLPLLFFGNSRSRLYLLISMVSMGGIFFYLAMFRRMNERVLLPLLMTVIIVNLFIFLWEKREGILLQLKVRSEKFILLILLLSLGFSYHFYALYITNRKNIEIRENFKLAYEDLNDLNKYLVVIPGGNFPFEGIPLLKNPNKLNFSNMIITSWMAHTPEYNKVLRHHQLYDIITDLYLRDDIILLGIDANILETYVWENYGVRTKLIPLSDLNQQKFRVLNPLQLTVVERPEN